jgi:hypothetical protein
MIVGSSLAAANFTQRSALKKREDFFFAFFIYPRFSLNGTVMAAHLVDAGGISTQN